jgi:cold shock CspA family protein
VVDEFDDPRGLGTVLGDDGRRYGFHCTAVADGSRHIEAGTRVTFTTRAGHLGRLEARSLVAAGSEGDG